MLTLRYLTSSPTKRPNPVVVTPGARQRKSSFGAGSGSGSFLSRSSGSPTRRRRIETIAVVGMLLVAWAWIMVFFGMILYHGYQYRILGNSAEGKGPGDHDMKPEMKQSLTKAVKEQSQRTVRNEVVLEPHTSPLVVFTCKRPNYLTDTLNDVLQYIPNDCSIGCPIIVSQDGNDNEVSNVIASFQSKFLNEKNVPLVHIQHKSALRKGASNSYQALAQHYGWALRTIFDSKATDGRSVPPDRVIILEEDIHIAPDFFQYFAAMAPILERDDKLLAVSAFNDNGLEGKVHDPARVLRSDFFPGLGWMMTRTLWSNELARKWPPGYWDDWLREPDQRQGRTTLHPEISRTYHFGTAAGASHNQFGDTLSRVHLADSTTVVDWTSVDTNVVENETSYWQYYKNLVESASLESSLQPALEAAKERDVRVEYRSLAEFKKLARQLGLMDDEKAGIPRTAYKGIVETRPHGEHFLFLVQFDALASAA